MSKMKFGVKSKTLWSFLIVKLPESMFGLFTSTVTNLIILKFILVTYLIFEVLHQYDL